MTIITSFFLSCILQTSPPGHTVHPIQDITRTPPRFNDAPKFQLRGSHRPERERKEHFTQTEKEKIELIIELIEEDLKQQEIKARVLFFNGNIIIRFEDRKDARNAHSQGKRRGNKNQSKGDRRNKPSKGGRSTSGKRRQNP
jgi:hypothetical protein